MTALIIREGSFRATAGFRYRRQRRGSERNDGNLMNIIICTSLFISNPRRYPRAAAPARNARVRYRMYFISQPAEAI